MSERRVRKPRKWLQAAAALVAAALIAGLLWLGFTPHTLVLTREDLQREAERAFPIEKHELVATIRFSDPQVILEEGSDRIGLGVDVSLDAPGIKPIAAKVAADGEVRYDAAEGALYLDAAHLLRLEAPGLPNEDARLAEPILSPFLASYLSRVPVYRLKSRTKRQLHSILVRNGRLIVTFAP